MSGAQIGGVVGGIIGFYFGGNWQLGYAIGSAIGGYVDPVTTYGPRLQEASTQTAMAGGFIPKIFGTAPVSGNIMWQGPVNEHKKKQGAKGSGQEQVTYTYTRSYAIRICRGSIAGLLIAKRNGKIVYDARPDSVLAEELTRQNIFEEAVRRIIKGQRATNAKFFEKYKVYTGDNTQMPDPTMEGYKGAGNVPAYRGIAYLVANEDDTQAGEVAQWEFVVTADGTTGTAAGQYNARQYNSEIIPWSTESAGSRDPRRMDTEYEYGYIPAGNDVSSAVWGYNSSIDALDAAISAGVWGAKHYGGGNPVLRGWSLPQNGSSHPIYPWDGGAIDANDYGVISLVFSRYPSIIEHDGTTNLLSPDPNSCHLFHEAIWSYSVDTARTRTGVYIRDPYNTVPVGGDDGFVNCLEGGTTNGTGNSGGPGSVRFYGDFSVVCRPKVTCDSGIPMGAMPVPDVPGWYILPDGTLIEPEICTPVVGTFKQLSTALLDSDDYTFIRMPQGPILEVSDPLYNSSSFWTTAYSAAVANGTLPSGLIYGVDYPVVTPDACQCVPETPTVDPDSVVLGTIVAYLCRREGLSADEYDVSQLTDLVPGFRMASESGADGYIAPLSQAYFFDYGEWDGKQHFVKRGADPVATITAVDLVARDGEAIEFTISQDVELLRKVTVRYFDPKAAYTILTQDWERRSRLIEARGEQTTEIPVVLDSDTAARIAHKRGKVAWAERNKQKYGLPVKWSDLTATDVVVLVDKKGKQHQVAIKEHNEDSGILSIDSGDQRQSTYTSNVTGKVPPARTPAEPTFVGPTLAEYMALPVWSGDADDRLGLYVAARGILGGWSGTRIMASSDAGATYSPIADIVVPANLGRTTTALAPWVSSEYPSSQTLTVTLPEPPDNVDYATMLTYRNLAALKLASGAWDILQWQTVVDNGNNSYTLGGLLRGRFATTPGQADAGAAFVVLDGAVEFVQVEQAQLGIAIKAKAVSYGTDLDNTVPQDVVIGGASQTEWPVHSLTAVRDGSDNVTVSWIGRARLGTETAPHHSDYFAGYRVTYSDGATFDVGPAETTHTRSSAPATQTVTVAALNSITGAGPASEGITI